MCIGKLNELLRAWLGFPKAALHFYSREILLYIAWAIFVMCRTSVAGGHIGVLHPSVF